MRKSILLLLVLFCMRIQVMAQLDIPVPEFKNTISLVDTAKRSLNDLERVTATFDSKLKGLGYGGHNFYFTLPGKNSTVNIEALQSNFVVKLPDADTDPNTYIELYEFESGKKDRTLLVGGMKMLGGTKKVDMAKAINLKFSKISPACFLITLPQRLKTGNYGFIIDSPIATGGSKFVGKTSATVFAFDINK